MTRYIIIVFIKNSKVKIYNINKLLLFKNEKVNDNAQKLLDTYSDVQKLELHRLDNITTSERSNGETYVSIMRNNLDLIKKELYQ